jgi:hypothetical protein
MWREIAFRFSSGRGRDHIAERFISPWTAKSSGAPLSQVILNAPFDWFPKHNPGFPHRSRHDADIREFLMRGLWTITAAHGHRQANDFTASFKPGIRQRS